MQFKFIFIAWLNSQILFNRMVKNMFCLKGKIQKKELNSMYIQYGQMSVVL